MKVITHQDIENLNISYEDCYKWVEEILMKKDEVILPPKISLKPKEGVFCNVMPCVIPNTSLGHAIEGVKVVTRYPDRKPSLDSKLLLLNADTGEELAIMDANWITAMRTGAVAAHSVKLFGKEGFKKVSILGLGNTARAFLLVLNEVMNHPELEIKLLRYKDQAEDYMNRFKEYPNLHFTIVDGYEELVRGAEVVVSGATYFENDICSDDCFDEGVLVVPIHTRGFGNCDLFFDKVYADDTGHVCHFKYFDKFKKFAEVSDVIKGNAVGRESDKERILAYNIGLSIHDLYYAGKIYGMLKDKDTPAITFNEPTEKFWI